MDPHGLANLLREIRPAEIYHLAAQSHVGQSFEIPDYTMKVNAMGTLNLLQAIAVSGLEKDSRLYNVRSFTLTMKRALSIRLTFEQTKI